MTIVVWFAWNQMNKRCIVTFVANRWQGVVLTLTFVASPTLPPMRTQPCLTLQRKTTNCTDRTYRKSVMLQDLVA